MAAFDEAKKKGKPTCLLDLIDVEHSFTLEETGDVLNVTRERVRQIEYKAMKTLSANGSAAVLREFRTTD